MKDFFISYNRQDQQWAEWLAWILEEAKYTVVVQAWDFRPGGNFVLDMQRAMTETKQTIAVLSDNYLKAFYTQPEWADAFARDPEGKVRTLLPVRVGECTPSGLLAMTVYVDLVDLSPEEAEAAVLGALRERAKPVAKPAFPGFPSVAPAVVPGETPVAAERVTSDPVVFPGQAVGRQYNNYGRDQNHISIQTVQGDQKIGGS